MKTLLIFLICPFFFCAAQEIKKEIYKVDQYGIREPFPSQIIKETPTKTEVYNTNYGIPELTPTYEIVTPPVQQLYPRLEVYPVPIEVPVLDNFEYLGDGLDN